MGRPPALRGVSSRQIELTALGCGADPRLGPTLDLLLSKQDGCGRWKLEYGYTGKMWADVETKGSSSKWVTLRALRVLTRATVASRSMSGNTYADMG